MKSLKNMIYKNMKNTGSKGVFVYNDFLNFGQYDNIRQAFSRLEKEGKIKKITSGIYRLNTYSELLRDNAPVSIDNFLKAVKRKFNCTITPNDAMLLNSMNLSTQVPGKYIFYTNIPTKVFNIGKTKIILKYHRDRDIANMSDKSAAVIRAIKAIGTTKISEKQKNILRNFLTKKEQDNLINESKQSSNKVRKEINQIFNKEESNV